MTPWSAASIELEAIAGIVRLCLIVRQSLKLLLLLVISTIDWTWVVMVAVADASHAATVIKTIRGNKSVPKIIIKDTLKKF